MTSLFSFASLSPFVHARRVSALALVLLPFAGGCFEEHVVAEDLSDGGTKADVQTCSQTEACAEPNIPSGCSLGPSSCVDGVYKCPEVICPAQDAGTCRPSGIACALPPIPSGCKLGPSTCVDGVSQCPAVICPSEDAGATCGGPEVCHEPAVPVGCHLGPSSCVNGVYQCPAVVCPDDAGTCDPSGIACSVPPIPSGCHLGPSTCPNGVYQCPEVICPDGGVGLPDASVGKSFTCGPTAVCDAETEYCSIFEGGAIQPDGGTPFNATCKPFPAACANDLAGEAATCACLKAKTSSQLCSDTNGGYTVTEEVP